MSTNYASNNFVLHFKNCVKCAFQHCRLENSRHMVLEIVYLQIFRINFYIPRDYISTTIRHGTIICGWSYNYNLVCGLSSQYGKYIQTHKNTTNIMKLQTVGTLILHSSDNTPVTFYYCSLESGCILHWQQCTSLTIPSLI